MWLEVVIEIRAEKIRPYFIVYYSDVAVISKPDFPVLLP